MSVSPDVQSFRDHEIRRCYKTEDLRSLSNRLGFRSPGYIYARLRSMGITDYLDRNGRNEALTVLSGDTLTPNEAYLLGYTMADGGIIESRPTSPTPRVQWECQSEDRILLEWINGFIGVGQPPKDYVRRRSLVTPTTGKVGPEKDYFSTKLALASRTLVERLAKWGVHPRKSCKETYHSFQDPLVHGAFLRGLFDGDGCVSTRQRKKGWHMTANVTFMGGEAFVTALRDDLVTRLGVESMAVISNNGRETCWKCNWSSKHDVEALFNHMYPDGKATFPCLYRKLAKFLEWLESEDGKIGRPRVRPLKESGTPESPEAPVNPGTSPSEQTTSPSDPVQL